jgi:L-fucose isomerase-like protein
MSSNKTPVKQPKKDTKSDTLTDNELVKYLKSYKNIKIVKKKIDTKALIKIVDIIKEDDYTIEDAYENVLNDDGKPFIEKTVRVCSAFTEERCRIKVNKLFYKKGFTYLDRQLCCCKRWFTLVWLY